VLKRLKSIELGSLGGREPAVRVSHHILLDNKDTITDNLSPICCGKKKQRTKEKWLANGLFVFPLVCSENPIPIPAGPEPELQ
jgi:hypothetical protein